jgi:ABC-type polysaccharide transport system permease subunit
MARCVELNEAVYACCMHVVRRAGSLVITYEATIHRVPQTRAESAVVHGAICKYARGKKD